MCISCLWKKKHFIFNPANYFCPPFEDSNLVNRAQLALAFIWKAWLLARYCH